MQTYSCDKIPTQGSELFEHSNLMASRWRMTTFAVDLSLEPVFVFGHERLKISLQNPFPSSSSNLGRAKLLYLSKRRQYESNFSLFTVYDRWIVLVI